MSMTETTPTETPGLRRVPREHELRVRKAAIAAARLCKEAGITQKDAAKEFGIGRLVVNDVSIILRHGTQEEIDNVENDRASIRETLRTIRKRTPKGDRNAVRARPHVNKDRKDRMAVNMVIWERLRAVLEALAGMPQPVDVAAVCRANITRTRVVDAKLMTTLSWITEFSDAWTK